VGPSPSTADGWHGPRATEAQVDVPALTERIESIKTRLQRGTTDLLTSQGVELVRGTARLLSANDVEITTGRR